MSITRADENAVIEQRVQAVLASRRNANASGQTGEDVDNIRAAMAPKVGAGETAEVKS